MPTTQSDQSLPTPTNPTHEDRLSQAEATVLAHEQQINYLANLLFSIAGTFFPAQTAAARGALGVAEEIFNGLGQIK